MIKYVIKICSYIDEIIIIAKTMKYNTSKPEPLLKWSGALHSGNKLMFFVLLKSQLRASALSLSLRSFSANLCPTLFKRYHLNIA